MTTKTTPDTATASASRFKHKVQLHRQIFSVDTHGKQTVQGFMLGFQRMSATRENVAEGNAQDWAALVLLLTAPVIDASTKKPFDHMNVGDEIYIGGVALKELYQRATSQRDIYEVQITPTTKSLNKGRSWDFTVLTADASDRAPFGPPIYPVRMAGEKASPQLGMGEFANGHSSAEETIDAILG